MPDREKVIAQLTADMDVAKLTGESLVHITRETVETALAMLRELEPVEPKVEPALVSQFKVYSCGRCDTVFLLRRQKYCANCGKPVKWE